MNFRSLFRWVILFIPCYSFLAIIFLVTEVYAPIPCFIIAVAISIITYYLKQDFWNTFINFDKSLIIPIILVSTVALFFRYGPYKMIHGGQDQGLYVNMSAHFQRGEETCFNDEFRESLPSDLKPIYDKNKYPNQFQPGTYISDCENDFVFQFYHLHPLWMSLFGELFGDQNRFKSLTFLSLLSIIGLMLILYEMSSSVYICLLFGLFLAVNPLHAYFSKWPVTEIPSLAFSSIGLWLLLKLWKNKEYKDNIVFSGVFAAVFFAQYFFTRISGFIFIPFVAFITLFAFWKKIQHDKNVVKAIFPFVLAVSLLYILSVFYGLEFSPNYARDIYRKSFSNLTSLRIILPGITIVLLLSFYLIYKNKRNIDFLRVEDVFAKYAEIILPILYIGVSFCGIYKAIHDPILKDVDFLPILIKSKLVNLLLYTGVILIPLTVLFYPQFRRKKFVIIFLVFLFAPVIYQLYLSNVLRFQYYTARYMVSELLPFILLFCFYILSFVKLKYAIICSILSSVLPIYYSICQIGVTEGHNAYVIFNDLVEKVNEDDIVLFEKENWNIHKSWSLHPHTIYTPLSIYYNLNLFPAESSEIEIITSRLSPENGKGLFLLSPEQKNVPNYKLTADYNHVLNAMGRSRSVPISINREFYKQRLYLYEYIRPRFSIDRIGFKDKIWTSDNAILSYNPPQPHSGKLIIYSKGWSPLETNLKELGLELRINNKIIPISDYSENRYIFNLDTTIRLIQTVEINCNTFVPKEYSLNNDSRSLGLPIELISF